jgi:CBS domain-containing protein
VTGGGEAVQVRDVMTREVVAVGPDTPVRYAVEVLAGHGFAALPVVDADDRLVGVVAEVDVLRQRIPEDPRLHARRDAPVPVPPDLVRSVMSSDVRSVDAGADVADVARLLVDGRLRSVPVLEGGRLAGIVSRRDLLITLVRPDPEVRSELLALIEAYTGEPGAYAAEVVDGVATIRRVAGSPQPSAAAEERAVGEIARTVGGVSHARIHCSPEAHEVPSGGSR